MCVFEYFCIHMDSGVGKRRRENEEMEEVSYCNAVYVYAYFIWGKWWIVQKR